LSIGQIELEIQNEELRATQLRLETEKERFADLYRNAPVGYMLLDKKGEILDCNNKASQIFAVQHELLLHKPLTAFVLKQYMPTLYKHLQDVFDNEDGIELDDVNICNHSGHTKIIRLRSNLWADKFQKQTFCRSILEDITERERITPNLAETSIRLNASMIAGNMAWWEMELPSGITRFNENKALMLGFKPEDFKVYGDFMKLVHPDDAENAMDAFRKHISGENDVYECEYRIRHQDGHYLWFYDVGKISLKTKESTLYNGIVQDVTARKFAEIALIESEENLRELINNVPLAVFLHRDGKILMVNKTTEVYTGYTKEELVENSVLLVDKLVPEADAVELWNNTIRGKSYILETEHTRKDGSCYPAEVNFTSINFNGNKAILAIAQDITERKRILNELKELNSAKDKFFSIIAHDLHTPYQALLGFSEILAKQHRELEPDTREKIILSIRNAAKSSFYLMESLLAWARTKSGKIEYNPQNTTLSTLVFEAETSVKSSADKKGIALYNTIDKSFKVFADRPLLTTVVRNLLSNAVKFTQSGGNVVVRVNSIDNENRMIVVSVTDTGMGMTESQIETIFRIDKQTSTRGTQGEPGTGLGILLCKEFIELHGGKIWVESTKGVGTTFFFTIPTA